MLVILGLCWPQASPANGVFSVGSRVDFSHGHYGVSTATEVIATMMQAKYKTDAISLQLDLPYLHVTGPGKAVTSWIPWWSCRLSAVSIVTIYGAHKLSSCWRTQLYVYQGTTNSSPAFGLGGPLYYQF